MFIIIMIELFPNNPFIKIKKWNDAKPIIKIGKMIKLHKRKRDVQNGGINIK